LRASAIRSLRAASRSRRRYSESRTLAPRGTRPGGETGESLRRAPAAPQLGQAGAAAALSINSSNRLPHCSHSNS
jgi:hypothetical protein